MNDLARVLTGARRTDKIRVGDLLNRAGIPSLNEIITRQSALTAWHARNTPNLSLAVMIIERDSRTRGRTSGLVIPATTRSVAAVNMAAAWNSSQDLRTSLSLTEARRSAHTLAFTHRMA